MAGKRRVPWCRDCEHCREIYSSYWSYYCYASASKNHISVDSIPDRSPSWCPRRKPNSK